MPDEYDVFLSHAWADGDRPQQIADALTKAGCAWFDAAEINDFARITRAVTEGLAKSKAMLAYYSNTYRLRRACQWKLTAAFLAAQTEDDPRGRVLVINPERARIISITSNCTTRNSSPRQTTTAQHCKS